MSLRLLTTTFLLLALVLTGLSVFPGSETSAYPALTAAAASTSKNSGLPQQWGGVTLLQPLGGLKAIQVSSGFGTFLTYFNQATEWLLIVVVGICVIWVLLGGFQIMLSGGFSGMDSAGKTHMIWAIAGLAITLFAGAILRLLNSMFYT